MEFLSGFVRSPSKEQLHLPREADAERQTCVAAELGPIVHQPRRHDGFTL